MLRVDDPVSVLEKSFWEAKLFVLEGMSIPLLNPGALDPYTVLFMPKLTELVPIEIEELELCAERPLLGSYVMEIKDALPVLAPSTCKAGLVVRVKIPVFDVGDGVRLLGLGGPTSQELIFASTTLETGGSEEIDCIIDCVDFVLEADHIETGFEVDCPRTSEGMNRPVG